MERAWEQSAHAHARARICHGGLIGLLHVERARTRDAAIGSPEPSIRAICTIMYHCRLRRRRRRGDCCHVSVSLCNKVRAFTKVSDCVCESPEIRCIGLFSYKIQVSIQLTLSQNTGR